MVLSNLFYSHLFPILTARFKSLCIKDKQNNCKYLIHALFVSVFGVSFTPQKQKWSQSVFSGLFLKVFELLIRPYDVLLDQLSHLFLLHQFGIRLLLWCKWIKYFFLFGLCLHQGFYWQTLLQLCISCPDLLGLFNPLHFKLQIFLLRWRFTIRIGHRARHVHV